MSDRRNTYGYLHGKSYLKPTSPDLKDFWSFHEKFQKLSKRQPGDGSSSSTQDLNELGVPRHFHSRHTVPFVCVSVREEQVDTEQAEELHQSLRQFVRFKAKQSYGKVVRQIEYQKGLPIYRFKGEIIRTVNENPITIIAGDTGCGKSTQVPQYFLEAGYESIACTQPRRIACVSLATRVSHETFNRYGQDIGYQVRFDQMLYAKTKLRFLTEGLLLRQLQNDPDLHGYDMVILDEVHERHLHGDLLLGILKCIVERRPQIRVVLMSATMNLQLFKTYLPDAPLITVPGRMHPVEVRYCPTHESAKDRPTADKINPQPYLIILQIIDRKFDREERGDLLIFASGYTEIMTLAEAITEYDQEQGSWIVLPLHSSLSVEEQQKVFDYAPPGLRKCIISTNIAETSLTIDGVRFIIDSGKFKEMAYDPTKKLQRLQEFWVSKASAEQRKGRAGRTGPGVCFRLYSEEDFDAFPDYPTPEILRVPLDSLILQLVSMGLNIRTFPFVQEPPVSNLSESLAFLQQQGALKSETELSSIGEVLSRLPVEVALGKLILSAAVLGVLEPALTIAAGLNIQMVFNKMSCSGSELQLRALLESGRGDLITLLNIYEEWSQKKSEGVNTKKWCKKRGLKEQQLFEMSKLRKQFREILRSQLNLGGPKEEVDNEKVRDIRRLKWKKKLEEPARKMLKVDHGKHKKTEEHESSEEEGPDLENEISSLEYHLTNPTPNLDLSRHVRDTVNFVCVFGLYPNIAISDQYNADKKPADFLFHTLRKNFVVLHPNSVFNTLHEDLYTKGGEQILAYSTLLETNKPYLMNLTRAPGLTTALLVSKEVATNEACTELVCDGWLRFTCKTPAEQLVHKAAKIRETWSGLLSEVLNRRVGDVKEFGKRQTRLQKRISSFLRSEAQYKLSTVRGTEATNLVCPGKASVQLTENITLNSVKDGATSDMEQYMQRAWTCKICSATGLFSLAERSEHLARCQEIEEKNEVKAEEEKSVPVAESTASAVRGIPKKEYRCEECAETFLFTNVEILRHMREHT